MAHSKEYTRLDDEDIVALVDQNVRSSVGYYSSDLSREREKVLNYYNAKLPKPHHEGNSSTSARMSFGSSVDASCAARNIRSRNRIVRFAPQNQDESKLSVCSAYTDYVLFRQNDGFDIFSQVIHDGPWLSRRG